MVAAQHLLDGGRAAERCGGIFVGVVQAGLRAQRDLARAHRLAADIGQPSDARFGQHVACALLHRFHRASHVVLLAERDDRQVGVDRAALRQQLHAFVHTGQLQVNHQHGGQAGRGERQQVFGKRKRQHVEPRVLQLRRQTGTGFVAQMKQDDFHDL